MIAEEYLFSDIKEYLYDNNNLLIAGEIREEERSHFFIDLWTKKNKSILQIIPDSDYSRMVEGRYYEESRVLLSQKFDLCTGLPLILRNIQVGFKNVLVDLSSLSHTVIMVLTKILMVQVVPKSLFVSYIRPQYYHSQVEDVGFSLCEKILGVNSVPGFTKRESKNQTLCAFIGFEGVRLKSILESTYNVQRFVPIVAFPSGSPQWFNITMWNSMDVLQSADLNVTIYKCYSESIFEAINLLEKILKNDEKIVLAPLGTRPHSMASAIYASKHSNVRIIYDYVVERECRAIGIGHITIYHLSSFLVT